MAIVNSAFIKFPFASNGDKTAIPVDTSAEGLVSWQQGFTPLYEQNPELGGKLIKRQDFNYILNYISGAINDLYVNGGRIWDQNIANNGGYPLGARCLVYYNVLTNQVVSAPVAGQTATAVVVSMKDANATSPYATNALFGDWFIDDGVAVGQVKIAVVPNFGTYLLVPSGYLDVGDVGNVGRKEYLLRDYPRIKVLLKQGFNENIGVIQPGEIIAEGGDYSNDATFVLQDVRGGFPRLFSNGGNIDSGRNFSEFQEAAVPNIVGKFSSNGKTTNANGAGGSWAAYSNYYASGVFGSEGSDEGRNAAQIKIAFDASKSSSFYKNGVDPRPYNFCVKMYLKV